jgi:hypothetical protein|tara:strand:+ start:1326 stop:1973 length:648 start_codon:yes stop_codon:yes gene_type:complete
MSFTLATLKTAIQNYTENDETTFTSTLDTFIKNTEERILKNTHLDIFRKNATGTMTASNQFLAMPTDFLSPFSLSITSSSVKTFLDFKDVNFIQTFNPNSSTTGTPRYYASFDVNTFIIGPTPDSNYSSELHYYYRPASLTAGSDSGTTWLSENATQAMLYGSLVEAYTFMKGEPDVLQEYEKRFAEAMVSIKMLGESRESTDEYRTGQVIRDKQ